MTLEEEFSKAPSFDEIKQYLDETYIKRQRVRQILLECGYTQHEEDAAGNILWSKLGL